MSPLVNFLTGTGCDARGVTVGGYLDADNHWWEFSHSHIQWAFPLPEPSKAQPTSPVADDVFYETIKNDHAARARMISLTGRYLQFLDQTTAWRRPHDHNHLRITRVLRCLLLCGLPDLAKEVFIYCRKEVGDIVGLVTWQDYWWEATTNPTPEWLP